MPRGPWERRGRRKRSLSNNWDQGRASEKRFEGGPNCLIINDGARGKVRKKGGEGIRRN